MVVIEVFQNGKDRPPVSVISDFSSIVAIPSQIDQSFVWDLFINVQHVFQLSRGYPEVTFIEFVLNIPAQ